MSLRGCDLVLGVKWFVTLGNIQLNYQEHTMALYDHNHNTRGAKQKQLTNMNKGSLVKVEQQGCELSLLHLTAIDGQDTSPQECI